MKKKTLNLQFDWQSKLVDLLIVILGISIAFKLNTWNESLKTDLTSKSYLESFYEENGSNKESLMTAIRYTELNKRDIDSLQHILITKRYNDQRIPELTASIMGLANYSPSTTTMENIKASGEFELIREQALRKNIINTYNAYKNTAKLQDILADYINTYVTPFFFGHVRFSDFSSLQNNFAESPEFENIVIGYGILLNQQINGYQNNLEKVTLLDEALKLACEPSKN